MQNTAEIWSRVISVLETKLSPVTMRTWIVPLVPIKADGSCLYLKAGDKYIRDVIEARYIDYIKEALRELFSLAWTVSISCGDEDYENNPASEHAITQNTAYSFENFVVGNDNRFAHAAAMAVAQNPGQVYNPLLIYGGPGLGKTHLLYAVADKVLSSSPSLNIVYVKGDEFTNHVIEGIQNGRMVEVRNKYRMADLLLVDDIQFIAGRDRTQEEFFHTFNTLYENKKQIILTSDRPPKDIYTLEERLRTRFEWGLLADIKPPDFETRMAIINKKCIALEIDIPPNLTAMIAESIKSDIRQLEGAVKKIKAYSSLMGMPLNEEMVRQAIIDLFTENPSFRVTPDYIIDSVTSFYNVDREEIFKNNRQKDVLFVRQASMYIIRQMTDLSTPAIGKIFKRDHSTVLNSLDKIEKTIKKNRDVELQIKDIMKNIEAR